MIQQRWRHRRNPFQTLLVLLTVALAGLGVPSAVAAADSYVPISGSGSTWAQNAVDAWRVGVAQYGMRINYAGTGSSDGRRQFLNGTTDFAVSDIPFQFRPEDGSPPENPAAGSYAYMPIVAGGTVLMYNLTINGQRVTNLRLSGENIAKIFTGVITTWSDPALVADNPGLTLPNEQIVPVVRSDGSGSTAQFSLWMIAQQSALWNDYCNKVGRSGACGQTSYYPASAGMIAKYGDLGVAGYVSQTYAEGSVGYVNYSYALNAGFPVVKMLNAAGYYTEPTADNVAVSLVKAKINLDSTNPELYLTQDLTGVYSSTDPRVYPLSSYSYFVLPTTVQGQFSADKGKTLGAFSYYFMCQGQQQAASLGYSPLPINLVQAGFDQIAKIPGVDQQNITVAGCNNPTFSPDGHNSLVDQAPPPRDCDKQGPIQCATGSGGNKQPTPTNPPATPATTAAPAPTTSGPGQAQAQAAPAGAPAAGDPNPAAPPPIGGDSAGAGAAPDTAAVLAADPSGTEASAPPVCDADTGACSSAAAAQPGNRGGGEVAGPAVDGGGVRVVAQSVPLAGAGGWGPSQTLMAVAGLCALLLIVVPPIVARKLGRNRASR